ncbi:hypothetical protein M0R04_11980 [Candidatus Dojkabacteria bacterium]|jgi:hypothetical protein|nr:hypothetical protein [Candidatus Dojkabacteria bacterium]
MEITKDTIKEGVKHSILRTLSVVSVLLIVGGLAYGLTFLFRKPSQNIVVEKGGSAQITQINKTTKFFVPFVEVYTMKESGDEGLGYGIKTGVRVEF